MDFPISVTSLVLSAFSKFCELIKTELPSSERIESSSRHSKLFIRLTPVDTAAIHLRVKMLCGGILAAKAWDGWMSTLRLGAIKKLQNY